MTDPPAATGEPEVEGDDGGGGEDACAAGAGRSSVTRTPLSTNYSTRGPPRKLHGAAPVLSDSTARGDRRPAPNVVAKVCMMSVR